MVLLAPPAPSSGFNNEMRMHKGLQPQLAHLGEVRVEIGSRHILNVFGRVLRIDLRLATLSPAKVRNAVHSGPLLE